MKNDKIKVIYTVDYNEYSKKILDNAKKYFKFPKEIIPDFITIYNNYTNWIEQSCNCIDLQQLFIIAHAFDENENFILFSNNTIINKYTSLNEIKKNKDFSKPLFFNVEKLLLFFEKYSNNINLKDYFVSCR